MPALFLSRQWGPPEEGGGPEPLSGEATFTAQSAAVQTGSVLFVAQSTPDWISGSVEFTAQGLPLGSVGAGREAVVYASSITGLPGPVLSWDYSHNGDAEELSVIVSGQFGLSNPSASLYAEARRPGGALLGQLPLRSFTTLGQEPQEDVGGNKTTFRFKQAFDKQLRGNLLPELIPWKDNPTPDPCLRVRQRISVRAVVNDALAGPGFVLAVDPLAGVYFEEGRYEFTTLGLTPQAVWDATYGALGMVLRSTDAGGIRRLYGCFPNPTSTQTGPTISQDWITQLSEGRELLQTPGLLTVKGGDAVTPLTPGFILGVLGADPAFAEVSRELIPNQEWIEAVESAGLAA